jgi:hypothetical protein
MYQEVAGWHGCADMEAAVSYFLPRLRPGGQLVVPWGEAGAAWGEVGAAFGEAEAARAAWVQPRQIGSCPACPPPDGVVDTIGTQNTYLQLLCCEVKKIAHFLLVVSVFCISTKYSNR